MAGKTGDGSRFASCSEGVFETGFAGTVPDGYGNGKKASGTTETVDDGGNETDAGMNEGGSCREGLLHQGYPVNAFYATVAPAWPPCRRMVGRGTLTPACLMSGATGGGESVCLSGVESV